jgi:hypothetical protein
VILRPLVDMLSQPLNPNNKGNNFPRQVIVLTDGEVDETEKVIQTAKQKLGTFSSLMKNLMNYLPFNF